MEFNGKVTQILEKEEIGKNKTPKQAIVIEEITDREYPWSIVVDFWRDNTETIEAMSVGDEVTVYLNSRAREYNGRWYNSISGWRIETVVASVDKDWDVDEDLPF